MNRRPRIVLTTTGTLGDFYPLLAIALALRDLGLDPVLASMEDYRGVVEAEGLPFHAVRPGNREMASRGLTEACVAQAVTADLRAGFDFMLPHLAATLEDLVPLIAEADLVIGGTLSAVARVVAESAGVPMITVLLQPMGFLSVAEPPTMREVPLLPRLRRLFGPQVVRMLYGIGSVQGRSSMKPIRALRRDLQLPRVRDELIDGVRRSERIFAMYPPAFARLPVDAPVHAQSAGFPFYDGSCGQTARLDPALEAFLARGEAPIIFTLGTFVVHAPGDFYEASARAARRLGRRAVLLVGKHAVERLAGLAGDDIAVAAYAPHSLLFPRAAAVVHHGGVGTTAQALRAGVPQLVCPLFGDQFDNAEHLRRLAVAEVVRLRRFTEDKAVAALDRLLSSNLTAARARALAPAMVQDDGPMIVARWVAERCSAGQVPRPGRRAGAARRR
jgi:rhamnosyltransferase subunit B